MLVNWSEGAGHSSGVSLHHGSDDLIHVDPVVQRLPDSDILHRAFADIVQGDEDGPSSRNALHRGSTTILDLLDQVRRDIRN
jgi:hypothetical protein